MHKSDKVVLLLLRRRPDRAPSPGLWWSPLDLRLNPHCRLGCCPSTPVWWWAIWT